MENENLELLHSPDKGIRTYLLLIPNTQNLKGKWGGLHVSGTIDDYTIRIKNLGPDKEKEKI